MSKETVSWIKEQFAETNELTQKTLELDKKLALIFYVKSVVDQDALQRLVIRPFFELSTETHFEAYIKSLPQEASTDDREQLLTSLTRGSVLVVIQNSLILLDLGITKTDEIQGSNVEPTIYGSQLGMSEHLPTNISIIRHAYHQPSLVVENHSVGKVNQLKVAIVYDRDKADPEVVEKVKSKLSNMDSELIQSSAQLATHLNNKKYALFPSILITERSDRMVYNISGGKVMIMTDGNPNAIILPTVFFDFMISMEDNYHTFFISLFVKTLRYIGLFACILLPSLYVGITSFSPEVFRVELAFSVAGSRIGVPYPSFIEVLFMLFFVELLLEASIRLPKAISATATTVGGLVLGTAATEAALASNIMIILVSAVAISTFVIPFNELAFSIRVTRLIILLFTTIFGLAGMVLAIIALIMYLVSQDAYGRSFLRLYRNNHEG